MWATKSTSCPLIPSHSSWYTMDSTATSVRIWFTKGYGIANTTLPCWAMRYRSCAPELWESGETQTQNPSPHTASSKNSATSGKDVGTMAAQTASTHPCTVGKHRAQPNSAPATITWSPTSTGADRKGRWGTKHKYVTDRWNSAVGSAETCSIQMIQREHRGHIRGKREHNLQGLRRREDPDVAHVRATRQCRRGLIPEMVSGHLWKIPGWGGWGKWLQRQ